MWGSLDSSKIGLGIIHDIARPGLYKVYEFIDYLFSITFITFHHYILCIPSLAHSGAVISKHLR